jgi:hypothetical protein
VRVDIKRVSRHLYSCSVSGKSNSDRDKFYNGSRSNYICLLQGQPYISIIFGAVNFVANTWKRLHFQGMAHLFTNTKGFAVPNHLKFRELSCVSRETRSGKHVSGNMSGKPLTVSNQLRTLPRGISCICMTHERSLTVLMIIQCRTSYNQQTSEKCVYLMFRCYEMWSGVPDGMQHGMILQEMLRGDAQIILKPN